MLNVAPKNKEKTVSFLQNLQRNDGSYDSVKVAYYVTETLTRLGHHSRKPLSYLVDSLEKIVEKLGDMNVYVDVSSEVEDIYCAVKVLSSLKKQFNRGRISEQIFKLRNIDGSFGRIGYSRLASTYYSLSTLSLLGCRPNKLKDTLRWIRRCEVPPGGFVGEPNLSSAYLVMEDIYYGVKTLEVLNESCRYPEETLEVIAKFQNPNGGFRRSILLGISDFESTYQAVSSIKTILSHGRKQLRNKL